MEEKIEVDGAGQAVITPANPCAEMVPALGCIVWPTEEEVPC